MPERTATSVNGVPIRLTDERWQHIAQEHPELNGQEADVLQAVSSPDEVQEARVGALAAVRRRK